MQPWPGAMRPGYNGAPLGCRRALTARARPAQILHLDIKSANVLLTKTLSAKISDVGIAKAMQSGEGIALTQACPPPDPTLTLPLPPPVWRGHRAHAGAPPPARGRPRPQAQARSSAGPSPNTCDARDVQGKCAVLQRAGSVGFLRRQASCGLHGAIGDGHGPGGLSLMLQIQARGLTECEEADAVGLCAGRRAGRGRTWRRVRPEAPAPECGVWLAAHPCCLPPVPASLMACVACECGWTQCLPNAIVLLRCTQAPSATPA